MVDLHQETQEIQIDLLDNYKGKFYMSEKLLLKAIAKALTGIYVNDLTRAERNIYNILHSAGILDVDLYNVVQLVE